MRTPLLSWTLATLFVFVAAKGLIGQDLSSNVAPQIIDNQTGKAISMQELVPQLAWCDVIFLGEKHDNDAGHQFQLQVIETLIENGHSIVLSTEQFERDVQGAVDDYLADRITEERFLAATRPWKNYPEHYRAIIELAKAKKIPVLAANLPRALAMNIAAGKGLSPHELVFAARSTTAPTDQYRTNFVASMKGHMGAEGSEKLQSFYAAQCAKDDAMAEAITDYLAKNQHRKQTVVHLCGHFHSDYGLGTASRVTQRFPLLRNAIVTMETRPKDGALAMEGMLMRAHFTFWTIDNPTKPDSGNKAQAP